MNELAQLRALGAKLRTTGKVVLTTGKSDVPSLSIHRLTYETAGNVPPQWPITGGAQFSFEFDETVSQWTISGSMFGITPKASDPKEFFSGVLMGARSREQTMRGFLQQTCQVAERYPGDLGQMCYRLGVMMGSVGLMVMESEYWKWTPLSDSGISVYFFPDNTPPEPFTLQKAYIGFNPSVKLPHWEITQHNLMAIREQLKEYAQQSKDYCMDLSSCFGHE